MPRASVIPGLWHRFPHLDGPLLKERRSEDITGRPKDITASDEILRKQSLALFIFPTAAAIGSSKQSSSTNRRSPNTYINLDETQHIAFIQCAPNFIIPQNLIYEIDLATPKELLTAAYEMQHDASTVTMHQMELASFITEIALATPKELQHDASTVPLDRITMDLGGTAAPLKSINSIEMNIYNMYVTQTVLNQWVQLHHHRASIPKLLSFSKVAVKVRERIFRKLVNNQGRVEMRLSLVKKLIKREEISRWENVWRLTPKAVLEITNDGKRIEFPDDLLIALQTYLLLWANFIVPQDFINEIDLATPKKLLTAAYEMQHDASTVTMHQMELASPTSY
ncbi:hypothetical protein BLOT_014412 [Blomia tropicalis]|nr:hypothetical protein BLOT_014412 [Blomia tropicalis]